ncbi:hypothetical protein [Halomicronema hongdechloris]|uniref:hypothetical protein n=1 Tax=Halomicronema hongdechloris TaxID=1209493 RepID=UPI001930EE48|nr:hypothetical protein [Halomicronema hongdechloris]
MRSAAKQFVEKGGTAAPVAHDENGSGRCGRCSAADLPAFIGGKGPAQQGGGHCDRKVTGKAGGDTAMAAEHLDQGSQIASHQRMQESG